MRDELAVAEHATTSWPRARRPGHRQGYAGLMAPPGATRPTSRPSPSPPDVRRMGLGRVLMHALIRAARDARRARGVPRGACGQPRRARPCTALSASTGIGVRPGYYQPDDVDAIVMRLELSRATGRPSEPREPHGPLNRDAPLVLGIETSCDETGHRHRARHDAARQHDRLVDGRARPLRRGGARGRRARPPRGARFPPSRPPSPRPASRWTTSTPSP